jgi:hypothetical protein
MKVTDEKEREELHAMMEVRLESILKSMTDSKSRKKLKKQFPNEPANQEKAEWNLSEIPILFGA